MDRISECISANSTMDRISEMPRDILQRILYFLTQKEAVRTSVLSKSWCYNWYTRPNLDFSFDSFIERGTRPNFSFDSFNQREREFRLLVDKTLQRYCDQRLSLEEFCLSACLDCNYGRQTALLEKWIPILTNMGVKKFCLSISCCRFIYMESYVSVPDIVFEAETLTDLHVRGLVLYTDKQILFKQLKALHLEKVLINLEMFEKIISSCPLMETLCLQGCRQLGNINVNSLDWSHESVFRKLKYLYLQDMSYSFGHFSMCKFPRLESLTLVSCHGIEQSHLFINAPNILRFEYTEEEYWFIPSISLATTSSKWDSHIILSYDGSPLCLHKISDLLKSLSQSTIFVTISLDPPMEPDHLHVPYNGCYKSVEVDTLYLKCDHLPPSSSLLNDLFRICHPRNVGGFGQEWDMEVLNKYLQESGNKYQSTQLLF